MHWKSSSTPLKQSRWIQIEINTKHPLNILLLLSVSAYVVMPLSVCITQEKYVVVERCFQCCWNSGQLVDTLSVCACMWTMHWFTKRVQSSWAERISSVICMSIKIAWGNISKCINALAERSVLLSITNWYDFYNSHIELGNGNCTKCNFEDVFRIEFHRWKFRRKNHCIEHLIFNFIQPKIGFFRILPWKFLGCDFLPFPTELIFG